jgi:manganese/zinc/iron transport system permease protein
VDLDPGCVLYGALELTPLDVVWTLGVGGMSIEVPRAALTLAAVLAFNIGLVWLFFKELKLVSFDADLASSLGFHANRLHYLLMVMVAVTAVAAFEVVGSILVIAMLVVPAATALLLTSSLQGLLVVSVLAGVSSAAIGHLLALLVPMALGFPGTSSAGMVATVSGLLFLLAWGIHRWRMRTRA